MFSLLELHITPVKLVLRFLSHARIRCCFSLKLHLVWKNERKNRYTHYLRNAASGQKVDLSPGIFFKVIIFVFFSSSFNSGDRWKYAVFNWLWQFACKIHYVFRHLCLTLSSFGFSEIACLFYPWFCWILSIDCVLFQASLIDFIFAQ